MHTEIADDFGGTVMVRARNWSVYICSEPDGSELTPDQARSLAAVLLQAADEVERKTAALLA